MAADIVTVFFAATVLSGLLMDLALSTPGSAPALNHDIRAEMTRSSLNYAFWLNLVFGALAACLTVQARRHPMITMRARTTPATAWQVTGTDQIRQWACRGSGAVSAIVRSGCCTDMRHQERPGTPEDSHGPLCRD